VLSFNKSKRAGITMEVYNQNNYKDKSDKLNNPRPKYFSTAQTVTFFLLGFAGFQFLGTIVGNLLYATGWYESFENIDFLSYRLLITYLILTLVMIILSYVFNPEKFLSNFKELKSLKKWSFILLGFFIIYSVALVIGMLQTQMYAWLNIEQTVNTNQTGLNSIMSSHPVLLVFVVSVLAPITEEITYRQGLFEMVRPKSKVWAYVTSIVIFSIIHFDIAGSFLAGGNGFNIDSETLITELISLPAYVGGAWVLTYVYDHENNVISDILVHGLYNFAGIMISLLI